MIAVNGTYNEVLLPYKTTRLSNLKCEDKSAYCHTVVLQNKTLASTLYHIVLKFSTNSHKSSVSKIDRSSASSGRVFLLSIKKSDILCNTQ